MNFRGHLRTRSNHFNSLYSFNKVHFMFSHFLEFNWSWCFYQLWTRGCVPTKEWNKIGVFFLNPLRYMCLCSCPDYHCQHLLKLWGTSSFPTLSQCCCLLILDFLSHNEILKLGRPLEVILSVRNNLGKKFAC